MTASVPWAPTSPCDPGCLPAPEAPARRAPRPSPRPADRPLRRARRRAARGPRRGRRRCPCSGRRRSGGCRPSGRGAVLAACGVRVRRSGPAAPPGALVVANHVSWLDVMALHAVAPVRMLAKREVRRWPLLGVLAARAGTVFLDRDRLRTLPDAVAGLAAALRAGATDRRVRRGHHPLRPRPRPVPPGRLPGRPRRRRARGAGGRAATGAAARAPSTPRPPSSATTRSRPRCCGSSPPATSSSTSTSARPSTPAPSRPVPPAPTPAARSPGPRRRRSPRPCPPTSGAIPPPRAGRAGDPSTPGARACRLTRPPPARPRARPPWPTGRCSPRSSSAPRWPRRRCGRAAPRSPARWPTRPCAAPARRRSWSSSARAAGRSPACSPTAWRDGDASSRWRSTRCSRTASPSASPTSRSCPPTSRSCRPCSRCGASPGPTWWSAASAGRRRVPGREDSLVPGVARALADDGVLVQFAYCATSWAAPARALRAELGECFEQVETSSVVWRNLPPAVVHRASRPRR